MADLKAAFPELDFNVTHAGDGSTSAHAVADLSVEESRNLRMAISNLRSAARVLAGLPLPLDNIRRTADPNFDIEKIPLDDAKTFALLLED